MASLRTSAKAAKFPAPSLLRCDGIKAKSRDIMLAKRGVRQNAPLYTGLSQVLLSPNHAPCTSPL